MANIVVPVIITCKGAVSSRPRLVRRREQQYVREICKFSIKFKNLYSLDEKLPDTEDEHTIRAFETRVLSFLEVEGVYTDQDGVIRTFQKPERDPWWLEVTSITSKPLKAYDLDLEGLPLVVGPTVDSQADGFKA